MSEVTASEQRAHLQHQLDQLDFERLATIRNVFAGDAFVSVVEELKSLVDLTDFAVLSPSVLAEPDIQLARVLVGRESLPNLVGGLAALPDPVPLPPEE